MPTGPGWVPSRVTPSGCPFADGSFDRVIASEVLEHIPDDETAMAELARVLRPGGSMAVTVPRCGPEFVNWALSDEYHNVPGGHVRIYRQSQLVGRLQGPGCGRSGATTPTASTPRTGGSAAWWAPTNDTHPAVATYHRLLVWDIEKAPRVTRLRRPGAQPPGGEEPGGLPQQTPAPAPSGHRPHGHRGPADRPRGGPVSRGSPGMRSIPESPV